MIDFLRDFDERSFLYSDSRSWLKPKLNVFLVVLSFEGGNLEDELLVGNFDEVNFSEFLFMRDPFIPFLFIPALLLLRCSLIDGDLDGLLEELALLQALANVIFEGYEILD